MPVGGKNCQCQSRQRGSPFELSVYQCPAHAQSVDERDCLNLAPVKVRNDKCFVCQLDEFVVPALKVELFSA
jgi:hypothetical protein